MEQIFSLQALWRFRWAAALVCCATIAASIAVVLSTTPVYEASAEILIVQADPTLRNLFEERQGDEKVSFARESNPINTHAELLRVSPLLKATIHEADLKRRDTGKLIGIEEFQKNLRITPLKGTDLIKVAYRDTNPETAAKVLNILSRRFAEANVEVTRKEANATLQFLEQQNDNVKQELDRNDSNLERFKSSNSIFDIHAELLKATEEQRRLEAALRETDLLIREGRGQVRTLSKKLGRSPDEAFAELSLSTHPAIQKLQGQLIEARTNPLLSSGLGEINPQIEGLRAHIQRLDEMVADEATIVARRLIDRAARVPSYDPLRTQLAQTLVERQITVASAEIRKQVLQAQLSAYQHHLRKLPKMELSLARMSRDREFNTELYQLLLKRREQARIAHAMTIGNVRIVQPADVPRLPVKPNPPQTLLAGLLLGLCLGAGTAFGLDAFDDTLRHEGRAREVLGRVPLFGRLPGRRRLERGGSAEALLTVLGPSHPHHDQYGILRLNMVRRLGPQFKLLLAGVHETEVPYYAANIALSFAQSGRRVLLIDGDMRHPMLKNFFETESGLGLKELLAGDANWEDVAAKIPGLPLWVVPTLEPSMDALTLLDSPRLWALKQATANFDVVLGIAPRVTAAPDALALANLFDNFWLVLNQRLDSREAVKGSVQMLCERGLEPSGALYVSSREG